LALKAVEAGMKGGLETTMIDSVDKGDRKSDDTEPNKQQRGKR
jgi:hypothetical protein